MSMNNTEEAEQLIIKLLRKLERKGKNIQSFLWQLMDKFEDGQYDEKHDENKLNVSNNKITLLYDKVSPTVCKVGHTITYKDEKHLSIEPCVICGHRNNNNIQNKASANNQQMINKFLDTYDIHQMTFGPHQQQAKEPKAWVNDGDDKKWPLHYAALIGDIVSIRKLAQNKQINIDKKRTNYDNQPPITLAARNGQLKSIIELIRLGANPIAPPDEGSQTPYKSALYHNHQSVVLFFQKYIQYLYHFEVDDNTNVECYSCYIYDLHFNKHILDGTMAKYVYCITCAKENVNTVKKALIQNSIIESRIIKTLKENPSISVDTLCQMKDVKSLHIMLKEVMISGERHGYSLWLLDIDNFKAINTHLTHAIADTKIQAVGQVLKKLEPMAQFEWKKNGYDGLHNIWAFRQGGDEFALVIACNNQKISILQKLYETLRESINNIKLDKEIQLDNGKTMNNITVSIGVCLGEAINSYEEMMIQADTAAGTIKMNGKNGIAIYDPYRQRICKNFYDVV